MVSKQRFSSFLSTFFFLSLFITPALLLAAEYPSPEVEPDSCPKDKLWQNSGHWGILRDGQYGAEVLEKSYGFKWKIARREGPKIIPVWCEARKTAASTELWNKEFSRNGHSFTPHEIVDLGDFKTTGFWVYK